MLQRVVHQVQLLLSPRAAGSSTASSEGVSWRVAAAMVEMRTWDYEWSNFSLEGFVAWLEVRLGRVIDIIPFPMTPDVFGMWLYSDVKEIIFVAEHLQGVHRLHAVLHELAHLILGHETQYLSPEALQQLADGKTIVPRVQLAFRQDRKTSREDEEAEEVAALLLTEIATHSKNEAVDDVLRTYLDV